MKHLSICFDVIRSCCAWVLTTVTSAAHEAAKDMVRDEAPPTTHGVSVKTHSEISQRGIRKIGANLPWCRQNGACPLLLDDTH